MDAEVFQTLTVNYHLKHSSAHRQRALLVWTMMRLLAYTLSVLFYHRQVHSHPGQRTPASLRECAQALRWLIPALDWG